jgi:UDP-galactopyranose mutase
LIEINRAGPPGRASSAAPASDHSLICFSHLRWNFVFQRPQHLMSRFAAERSVIYWEEPVYGDWEPEARRTRCPVSGVEVVTPHLPNGLEPDSEETLLRALLDQVAGDSGPFIRWYYTPMMLPFSQDLPTACTVYDCMDELAAFRFAPPQLLSLEQALFDQADIVFTGGFSLYEAKKGRHPNIHPFPSSVDRAHFMQARTKVETPVDQRPIAGPRLGYYGVIDERMDLDLIAALADARLDWSIVMVGPVVKLDPADLPRRPNLHFLGGKDYSELPAYLAGWDVALMPFAINESTRFISPTKTPEYLAGGKPVVSTPVKDVIRHYGDLEGVTIAASADAFVQACEAALALPAEGEWLAEVDVKLANLSWDTSFARMSALVEQAIEAEAPSAPAIPVEGKAYDYLIVGAGFAGSVLAERLASEHDAKVLVIDRRDHIGGNAYDRLDEAGLLIHQYGPHIFHTNSDEIFAYLSRFTDWRPYEHRVLADVRGQQVPIPINRTTLNMLFGLELKTDEEAAAYLASRAEPVDDIRTSEDVVVNAVGRELYELFFQGYTRKQWGIDPSGLDKAVTARIPTRTNVDDRYFGDTHQAMPRDGYTAMFRRMLDHPNIEIMLGVDWAEVRDRVRADHLIFTGPIDEYFGHRFGKLPYRSLRFEHATLDQPHYQPVATVNYPAPDVPFTRITEYKHLTGQVHSKTSITHEYPAAEGDPYYPIPRPENQALFKRYEALADATPGVTFVGRLATYRYYNMDQVVGQALTAFRRLDERKRALDEQQLAEGPLVQAAE